jgi:hypothetical protein
MQLQYADKDAKLLYDYLIENQLIADQASEAALLLNEQALQANFYATLGRLLMASEKGDRLLIYFAGHWDVPEVDDHAYLLCQEAPYQNGDYEFLGGINSARINDYAQRYAGKGVEIILVLDACRAGKVIDDQTKAVTMKSFGSIEKIGKMISCRPHQYSYESDQLQHGVFTYYLVKGLDGEAEDFNQNALYEINEVEDYVEDAVSDKTENKQKPDFDYAADLTLAPIPETPKFDLLQELNKVDENTQTRAIVKPGEKQVKASILLEHPKVQAFEQNLESARHLTRTPLKPSVSDENYLPQIVEIAGFLPSPHKNDNFLETALYTQSGAVILVKSNGSMARMDRYNFYNLREIVFI